MCSRCSLTKSAGCRHCFCNGQDCEHEDEACDIELSESCGGNVCNACRRSSKKVKIEEEFQVKLEEELQTSSAASFHRPSRDAAVSEAQAFDRNKDMMAFQMFLKPLRTSQDQFTDTEFDLLLPFLRLMDEPRSKEVRTEMHVLLRQPAGPARKKKLKDEDLYITNSIPNSRNPKKIVHDHLCGFDKYNKVHGAESVSQHQLDVAQHEATLGFDSSHSISHYDGWGSWAARIPTYLLPHMYQEHTTSEQWACDMEGVLLAKLRERVCALGRSFDERLRIAFVHALDQSKLGASFSWHRDIEEQHIGRQIKWSMVILLRFDAHGKAASMWVAGAKAHSHYPAEGAYHVFDASLYHTTVKCDHGGVKLGVFFATPW